MSTFEHPGLMQDLNEGLKQFRSVQPEAIQVLRNSRGPRCR